MMNPKELKILRVPILLIAVAISALVWPTHSRGASDRRDGNWWEEQSESLKLDYATGFFDGIELGNHFSYWNFVNDRSKSECRGTVMDSYNKYGEKYLSNVTNGQLVVGLDKFYADYKNRRIKVHDAVWIVLNGISGMPEKDLEELTENWRRNSAK